MKLNIELPPGGLILIEGDNGSGKTSLAKAILKRSLSEAGLRVAYLPQIGNTGFFLPLVLRDIIRFAGDIGDSAIADLRLLDPELLDRPWNSASGGERQKTLLARALLSPVSVLILDEPFNHLDSRGRMRAVQLIASARAAGRGLILVSHERSNLSLSGVQQINLGSA